MSVDEEKLIKEWLLDNLDGAAVGVEVADRSKHVQRGPFRPAGPTVVDPTAWVLASGGDDIRRRDWIEESPRYSILVRSPVRDYDAGRLLVSEVERIFNTLTPPGFFDCHVVGGRGYYLREDDQNQHLWSINIALKKSA